MNYRHVYHAGNFADVVKHIILTRVIAYLQRKDAGFLYLDTHAGTGRYDLSSVEAQKTGEWRDGIGRLIAARAAIPNDIAPLLAPYFGCIERTMVDGMLSSYPGSPRVAHAMRRRQDRISAIELHPQDHAALAAEFAGAHGIKVHNLDGWDALKAQLPPKEKRGVVLIDPPFEDRAEFDQIIVGLRDALKRFATGVYCIWYPLKNEAVVDRFHAELAGLDWNLIDVQVTVDTPLDEAGQPRFFGTGMVIINPPYVLADELRSILGWLAPQLERTKGAGRFSISAGN